MNNKLPNKPSELIEAAIIDFKKCIAHPDYEINMGFWHGMADLYRPCPVCLSGGMMAQTLGATRGAWMRPEDYPPDTARKLWALNSLRLGYIKEGLGGISIEIPAGWEDERLITNYDTNSEKFFADMNGLKQDLEEAGL